MFYLRHVAWSALPTATQLEPNTALLSSWKMSGQVNQEAGGVLAAATPTPGSQRSTSCWSAASLSCPTITYSAVHRSIGFTIGFHNHGEGPY